LNWGFFIHHPDLFGLFHPVFYYLKEEKGLPSSDKTSKAIELKQP
jgi:hypothetical protein